jgi:hypothetical protein
MQMQMQEGATVEWERPLEQRVMAEMTQEVIVNMVAAGNLVAIKVAVDKFRKHMRDRATATIEDVEERGDTKGPPAGGGDAVRRTQPRPWSAETPTSSPRSVARRAKATDVIGPPSLSAIRETPRTSGFGS